MIKLYNLVKESNLINKEDILLDAYSGTSTIGIYLSDKVKKVISVESNTSSYLNALDNVKLNNVNNLECINEDCTKYINETNDHFSVVVMDPPRSGCSFSFLNALINKKVNKLIYVSCNPKTLKRDLNILKEYYDILSITPLDMFPNTLHIETVVELKRKDELDIIANKIMNKHIEAFKELAK
jgi:23S rRNA (uracil1939-C5)-methyltransferase